jgi:hypothetical protein
MPQTMNQRKMKKVQREVSKILQSNDLSEFILIINNKNRSTVKLVNLNVGSVLDKLDDSIDDLFFYDDKTIKR